MSVGGPVHLVAVAESRVALCGRPMRTPGVVAPRWALAEHSASLKAGEGCLHCLKVAVAVDNLIAEAEANAARAKG